MHSREENINYLGFAMSISEMHGMGRRSGRDREE